MKSTKTIWAVIVSLAIGCAAFAQDTSQAPQGSQPAPATVPGQADANNGASSTDAGSTSGVIAPKDDPRLDQPQQPLPPLDEPSSSNEPQNAPGPAAMVPDNTPLNSPQELTLGTPGGGSAGRNFVTPSLRFSQYLSHSSGQPNEGITNLSGQIMAMHHSARNSMMLTFTGGGTLYAVNSDLDAPYEQLSFSDTYQRNRWTFNVSDQGSYLPESSFGFFGLQFSGGVPGVGNGYTPNQSILTVDSKRISNTANGEVRYQLGPRTSIHASESWGILRFQGGSSGLQNSDQYISSAGLDRTFGSNTLGFAYTGSMFRYGGASRDFDAHSFNVAYGRRVTGKLALQFSAGPQIHRADDPTLGTTDTEITWNMRAALSYRLQRTILGATFTRNATAGSGVFLGAETYQWEATVSRPLARVWNASGNFGYARNTSFEQLPLPDRQFNSMFVGAQVSRVIGRTMSAYFSYNFQHQTSNAPVCLGCSDSFNRQFVGVGFEWHSRPMALDQF